MTAQLERPVMVEQQPDHPHDAQPGWWRSWWHRHRRTLCWVGPLTLLAAVLSLVNMTGAPQRIDDEGTYTAQAWAILHLHELTHYTYWYDHPPLGWIQIAAWTGLTGGFDRYSTAVAAGREAMVVAHLVSVVLVWVLARRLGMRRPAAGLATLIMAVSPLSVQFSRTVYLDNVAVPWALGSFVLAMSRRNQLAAFAGSALCFGVAVLSKETFALLLPFLVWQLWRSAHPSSRRYTLSVAASLFALIVAGYVAFALVKGEVLPGSNRVSLLSGVAFQLLQRQGSGSVFEASTQAGRSVRVWLTLDSVLPWLTIASVAIGLFVRRLRPLAALVGFSILVVLKPGYLPVPYVIALIPFAALLVAGVADTAFRDRRRATRLTAAVVALAAAVAAVPLWGTQLRGLLRADLDRPLAQAEHYIDTQVPHDQRLLVDDAAWTDLVRDGFARTNVVWYYKADTDPAVERRSPNGWKDYDYILVTQALRRSAGTMPVVDTALRNATRVAQYGSGEQQVAVYQVHAEGASVASQIADRDAAARPSAGRALAANPRLELSGAARKALASGAVDSRLITLLATLSADHRLRITSFPTVDGEYGPARSVRLTADRSVLRAAEAQVEPFRPDRVVQHDGVLTLGFALTSAADLLPSPTS
ncbi:phospholipid carrier-dependent glycosyltransferase [Nocardioides mangrovicus]|uniref:Phospholipid carrier-dependent glycosyltransferase n=1 Tax=Nocardioides mangrovicus TaxID=2478913 RepID=A0A3L8P0X5_9ACTN|nr:glycosyltransferase family 39 protein [Nocardioides mangrovicus]RLV49096.1 phospholipid carrier-dependent glycosyltransferase [Nocardioides mangrovicus]